MTGCSFRKRETIFHIGLILICFFFCRRQTTAAYLRQSISSRVSAHNSGSAGLMQLCLLRVRQVFVAISKPTPFKAAQLWQWQVREMWPSQPAVTLTDLSQELLFYNRNRFTTLRCLHGKYLLSLCFGCWKDFFFCWKVKRTQHKSALIQVLCSILWFLNVFGMNTNGSNRNGSMKRRLPNSISVNNFIDLFVRAPLSGVSPRDEQGKTESSELVLQKSKVKVSC